MSSDATHSRAPVADALAGARVVDFTLNLPGPLCVRYLHALGAHVTKVEPPHGDPARLFPAFFEQLSCAHVTTRVDLKSPEGHAQARALCEQADIVVEGFRPGVMARLGLDDASVRACNPRVIYCSISAFGQVGPMREVPGHDLNVQALAGACGSASAPNAPALPVADLSTGLMAALAIVAAHVERTRTGQGRAIDLALFDTVFGWSQLWSGGMDLTELATQAAARSPHPGLARLVQAPVMRNVVARLGGLGIFALPHYGVFNTRDGASVALGIVDEQKFWKRLCALSGSGALAKLGNLSLGARVLAGPVLRRWLRHVFAQRTAQAWLADARMHDLPITAVEGAREASQGPLAALRFPQPRDALIPPALRRRSIHPL